MQQVKVKNFNKIVNKFVVFLFYLIPLSMFGQALINLMIISLIILFIIFVVVNSDIDWVKEKLNIILLIFALYLVINGYFISDYNISKNKSIFYIKFILFFISSTYFFKKFDINLEKLLKIYLILNLFITIDVIIQYLFKSNLIGFPCQMNCSRFSSFFGDELIAGTYLFFFGFLSITYFLLKKKYFIFIFASIYLTLVIFLTGDRTPFFLSLILVILNILFNRSLRKLLIFALSLIIILIFFSFSVSNNLVERYIKGIKNIILSAELNSSSMDQAILSQSNKSKNLKEKLDLTDKKLNFNDYEKLKNKLETSLYEEEKLKKRLELVRRIEKKRDNKILWYHYLFDTTYGAHYLTSIDIIKNNFIFGAGLKSFRIECHNYNNINSFLIQDRCSTHPHNLHLEILSETGIVGYFILITVFLFYFMKFKNKNKNTPEIIFLTLVFLTLVIPFKPSGSFYSTWFGMIIWSSFAFAVFFVNNHSSYEK